MSARYPYADGRLAVRNTLDALRRFGRDGGLTPALEQRLVELGLGLSNQEIAIEHEISLNTVKTEVSTLLRILGLSCRHEIRDAVKAAIARLETGERPEDIRPFLQVRFG